MLITFYLGDYGHEIHATRLQESESLIFHFTWHEPVTISAWTLRSLPELKEIPSKDDFIRCERQFIKAAGFIPKLLRP